MNLKKTNHSLSEVFSNSQTMITSALLDLKVIETKSPDYLSYLIQ